MKKSHFTENEFSFFFPTRSGIIFRGSVIIFLYIKKLQYLLAYTVICGQLTKHSVFFPAALQERCLPTFQTKSKYMFMFFEKNKSGKIMRTHTESRIISSVMKGPMLETAHRIWTRMCHTSPEHLCYCRPEFKFSYLVYAMYESGMAYVSN